MSRPPLAKPVPRKRRPNTALNWLTNNSQLAGLVHQAQTFVTLREQLTRLLPSPLGSSCHIARLDNGRLTLAVASASIAAKLRQMTPRIQRALSDQGWNIQGVEVQIQSQLTRIRPATPLAREARPLDQTALTAFDDLHRQLPSGPLADAVAKLLSHHGHRAEASPPASSGPADPDVPSTSSGRTR